MRRLRLIAAIFTTMACARSDESTRAAGAAIALQSRPLVIAHRGASGHRPEHTLEAYALAIQMGADFIEPDLVSTKDGVLVARHENEIGETTDVARKFPQRRTTKNVDGERISGWFVEDFTAAELRTLRAVERLPFRSHAFDGHFVIPTFAEILALADSAGRRRGRAVGVYPETKHPTYFRNAGLPLEERLVAILHDRGLATPAAPVFIQSFEAASLRRLRRMTQLRLVQLVSSAAEVSPEALREIKTYADAIGANTRLLIPSRAGAPVTPVISNAHAAGLQVHAWTLRSEPRYLAARYGGDPEAEVRELIAAGVDGLFGDFPDVLVRVVSR